MEEFKCKGEVIESISLVWRWGANDIRIKTSNHTLYVHDEHRCCEERFITTDDNLDDAIGYRLLGWELRHHHVREKGWKTIEIAFLYIYTSVGILTFQTHNEHNGYYGGFRITIEGDEE